MNGIAEYDNLLFKEFLACAAGDDFIDEKKAERTVREYERAMGADLYTVHEGQDVKVRELLQSTKVESTTLVQTQFQRTLIKAADDVKCIRNVLPVQSGQKGPTARFIVREATTGTTGSTYVDEVAEGSDIPMTRQNYSYIDAEYKKIALRPSISSEMINDGLYDTVREEGEFAAKLLENQLNQDGFNSLVDNATSEHDVNHGGSGTNTGIKALAYARADVTAYGFTATKAAYHPEFEQELLTGFTPSNYYGAQGITATGTVGHLLGMDLYMWGGASSGTQTWGYAADGEIGGIVLDPTAAGKISFAWDLQMEKYDDPIKDLMGMKVSMRYAVSYTNANAISRIEY